MNHFEKELILQEAIQAVKQGQSTTIETCPYFDFKTFESAIPIERKYIQETAKLRGYLLSQDAEDTNLEFGIKEQTNQLYNLQNLSMKDFKSKNVIELKSNGKPIKAFIEEWLRDFIEYQKSFKSSLYGMLIYNDRLVLNIGHPLVAMQILEYRDYLSTKPFKALIYEDGVFLDKITGDIKETYEDMSKNRIENLLLAYMSNKYLHISKYNPNFSPFLNSHIIASSKIHESLSTHQVTSEVSIVNVYNIPNIIRSMTTLNTSIKYAYLIPTSLYYHGIFIPHYGVSYCDIDLFNPHILKGGDLTPFLNGNINTVSNSKNICTGSSKHQGYKKLLNTNKINFFSMYHNQLYRTGASIFKDTCLEISAKLYKEEL